MPQQDWFTANAPKAQPDEDWFALNATKRAAPTPTESPLYPHARVGRAVIDAAKGAGAGALSTIYHGGDLIRRGLGMERVIERPNVQQAMTPPQSLPGKAGFLVEQAAEFGVPLARIARITKGAPLLKRMMADAAASTAVAGVQSGGETGNMALAGTVGAAIPGVGAGLRLVKSTAQKAAAGAAEGGLGGAVAQAVRTTTPMSSKAMLVSGLKPRNTRVNFEQALDAAMPEIKASEAVLGKPIAGIDDLLKATEIAKKRIRADYDAIADPMRDKGSLVDLTPVADAMEASIPYKVRLENPDNPAAHFPGIVTKLIQQAKVYRGQFKLEQAEQLLKETNAELEAFYNKFPLAQRRALLADPEVARLNAQAKTLRDAIYKTLDSEGQTGAARALNRTYGQLLEIEDTAVRRANVAKRQQPESLNEQFSKARAAGEIARGGIKILRGDLMGAADIAAGKAMRDAAKFMKEQQTTDALIRRAFAAVKTGSPVRTGAR